MKLLCLDSVGYCITPAYTNTFKSSSNEKAVQYTDLRSINNSPSREQLLTMRTTETFQSLLSEQNMGNQSSSVYQPEYSQLTSAYQPPSQDIQGILNINLNLILKNVFYIFHTNGLLNS